VKIPTWALCYLVNIDDSALDAEDKKIVDDWVERMRDGGTITVDSVSDEAYFCRMPAFGLACNVEDCIVIVDKSPRYSRCDYPCCGQSRYEPVKRQAINGKWWWCVYDNKIHGFVPGERFKTRKSCVVGLFMDFKHDRKEYEPDDDKHTLEWLKKQTEIPV